MNDKIAELLSMVNQKEQEQNLVEEQYQTKLAQHNDDKIKKANESIDSTKPYFDRMTEMWQKLFYELKIIHFSNVLNKVIDEEYIPPYPTGLEDEDDMVWRDFNARCLTLTERLEKLDNEYAETGWSFSGWRGGETVEKCDNYDIFYNPSALTDDRAFAFHGWFDDVFFGENKKAFDEIKMYKGYDTPNEKQIFNIVYNSDTDVNGKNFGNSITSAEDYTAFLETAEKSLKTYIEMVEISIHEDLYKVYVETYKTTQEKLTASVVLYDSAYKKFMESNEGLEYTSNSCWDYFKEEQYQPYIEDVKPIGDFRSNDEIITAIKEALMEQTKLNIFKKELFSEVMKYNRKTLNHAITSHVLPKLKVLMQTEEKVYGVDGFIENLSEHFQKSPTPPFTFGYTVENLPHHDGWKVELLYGNENGNNYFSIPMSASYNKINIYYGAYTYNMDNILTSGKGVEQFVENFVKDIDKLTTSIEQSIEEDLQKRIETSQKKIDEYKANIEDLEEDMER